MPWPLIRHSLGHRPRGMCYEGFVCIYLWGFRGMRHGCPGSQVPGFSAVSMGCLGWEGQEPTCMFTDVCLSTSRPCGLGIDLAHGHLCIFTASALSSCLAPLWIHIMGPVVRVVSGWQNTLPTSAIKMLILFFDLRLEVVPCIGMHPTPSASAPTTSPYKYGEHQ